MKLHAVRDDIIVCVIQEKMTGKIHIPDSYKARSGEKILGSRAKVISVGPDYPYRIKEGDIIIFEQDEGFPLQFEDKSYLCLKRKRVAGREE